MAQTYSNIYAFGDSLSDAGNLSISTTVPVSPPYYKEQYGSSSGTVFSNGPVWVQDLAADLGLTVPSPSLNSGTDFAYGGAETGATPQNASSPEYTAISLPAQLAQFKLQVPNPSPTALYTLSIGSNDIDSILATSLTSAQQTTDINDAVSNEISFVKSLISDGAKNLLILNVPDLGKIPEITLGLDNGSNMPSAAYDALASQLSAQYNAALTAQLATVTGATIQVADAYTLLDNATANPAAYGLTNVTSPVWNGSFVSASSGTLAATTPATQDQYLYFDDYHPTETGQQAIANLAYQTVTGQPALSVVDATTNQPVAATTTPYTGPVAGLTQQYINVTTDNLNIAAETPGWFIHSGAGEDAIAVTSGTNVLDGGTGSNFLTGGTGTDTFFVDERGATAATWSTLVNFHAGDSLTLWGVNATDFTLSWMNGAGAAGYTGLTLSATAAVKPEAIVTLAGFTQTALTNGSLSVTYGTDAASGSIYTNIHANSAVA